MTHASGNTTWQDYPSTATMINATRLEAIEGAHDQLRQRVYGSETRTRPARAIIECTTPFTLNTSQGDVFAAGGWTAAVDTESKFMSGSPSYWETPYGGRQWDVGFEVSCIGLPAGQTLACKVTYFGTSILTQSLCSDAKTNVITHEVLLHAFRWNCEPAAGGRFYWAVWTSNPTNITIGTFNTNVKTRFYARDVGPAT